MNKSQKQAQEALLKLAVTYLGDNKHLLKERERECTMLLMAAEGKTTQEIAKEYDLTSMRVSQILDQANRRVAGYITAITSMKSEEVDKLTREKIAKENEKKAIIDAIQKTSIEELGLSARAKNVLIAAKITTIEGLCSLYPVELMKLRNMGMTSITEIEDKLATLNLRLGQFAQ